MKIKPNPDCEKCVNEAYSLFSSAYQAYGESLSRIDEATLLGAIGPVLGDVPPSARVTEIMAEISDLNRLEGKTLSFGTQDVEPGDRDYPEALADHRSNRIAFIKYLIRQYAKK